MSDVLERPTGGADARERRAATIYVRAPQRARDLIGRAAEASGKTTPISCSIARPGTPWTCFSTSAFSCSSPGTTRSRTLSTIRRFPARS